jgi:hypothetical protein
MDDGRLTRIYDALERAAAALERLADASERAASVTEEALEELKDENLAGEDTAQFVEGEPPPAASEQGRMHKPKPLAQPGPYGWGT